MPEIPLSVGSKLELLLSLPNFRILPRTLTLLPAYAYCRVYYNVHDRVLHFSAFINTQNDSSERRPTCEDPHNAIAHLLESSDPAQANTHLVYTPHHKIHVYLWPH